MCIYVLEFNAVNERNPGALFFFPILNTNKQLHIFYVIDEETHVMIVLYAREQKIMRERESDERNKERIESDQQAKKG